MNFGKLKACICNLDSRLREVEENGGGGGGGTTPYEFRGEWETLGDGFEYAINDLVIYDDPGDNNGANLYLCIAAHISDIGTPPPGNADWVLFVQGGENGADGTNGATGPAGPADISFHGFFEGPSNKDYILILHANVAGTINSLVHKTVSGTLTAAIKINGVAVTGLSAVSVTSSKTTTNATAANTFAIGDTITLTVSSGSSPLDFQLSLLCS